jgi:hypothetical protein
MNETVEFHLQAPGLLGRQPRVLQFTSNGEVVVKDPRNGKAVLEGPIESATLEPPKKKNGPHTLVVKSGLEEQLFLSTPQVAGEVAAILRRCRHSKRYLAGQIPPPSVYLCSLLVRSPRSSLDDPGVAPPSDAPDEDSGDDSEVGDLRRTMPRTATISASRIGPGISILAPPRPSAPEVSAESQGAQELSLAAPTAMTLTSTAETIVAPDVEDRTPRETNPSAEAQAPTPSERAPSSKPATPVPPQGGSIWAPSDTLLHFDYGWKRLAVRLCPVDMLLLDATTLRPVQVRPLVHIERIQTLHHSPEVIVIEWKGYPPMLLSCNRRDRFVMELKGFCEELHHPYTAENVRDASEFWGLLHAHSPDAGMLIPMAPVGDGSSGRPVGSGQHVHPLSWLLPPALPVPGLDPDSSLWHQEAILWEMPVHRLEPLDDVSRSKLRGGGEEGERWCEIADASMDSLSALSPVNHLPVTWTATSMTHGSHPSFGTSSKSPPMALGAPFVDPWGEAGSARSHLPYACWEPAGNGARIAQLAPIGLHPMWVFSAENDARTSMSAHVSEQAGTAPDSSPRANRSPISSRRSLHGLDSIGSPAAAVVNPPETPEAPEATSAHLRRHTDAIGLPVSSDVQSSPASIPQGASHDRAASLVHGMAARGITSHSSTVSAPPPPTVVSSTTVPRKASSGWFLRLKHREIGPFRPCAARRVVLALTCTRLLELWPTMRKHEPCWIVARSWPLDALSATYVVPGYDADPQDKDTGSSWPGLRVLPLHKSGLAAATFSVRDSYTVLPHCAAAGSRVSLSTLDGTRPSPDREPQPIPSAGPGWPGLAGAPFIPRGPLREAIRLLHEVRREAVSSLLVSTRLSSSKLLPHHALECLVSNLITAVQRQQGAEQIAPLFTHRWLTGDAHHVSLMGEETVASLARQRALDALATLHGNTRLESAFPLLTRALGAIPHDRFEHSHKTVLASCVHFASALCRRWVALTSQLEVLEPSGQHGQTPASAALGVLCLLVEAIQRLSWCKSGFDALAVALITPRGFASGVPLLSIMGVLTTPTAAIVTNSLSRVTGELEILHTQFRHCAWLILENALVMRCPSKAEEASVRAMSSASLKSELQAAESLSRSLEPVPSLLVMDETPVGASKGGVRLKSAVPGGAEESVSKHESTARSLLLDQPWVPAALVAALVTGALESTHGSKLAVVAPSLLLHRLVCDPHSRSATLHAHRIQLLTLLAVGTVEGMPLAQLLPKAALEMIRTANNSGVSTALFDLSTMATMRMQDVETGLCHGRIPRVKMEHSSLASSPSLLEAQSSLLAWKRVRTSPFCLVTRAHPSWSVQVPGGPSERLTLLDIASGHAFAPVQAVLPVRRLSQLRQAPAVITGALLQRQVKSKLPILPAHRADVSGTKFAASAALASPHAWLALPDSVDSAVAITEALGVATSAWLSIAGSKPTPVWKLVLACAQGADACQHGPSLDPLGPEGSLSPLHIADVIAARAVSDTRRWHVLGAMEQAAYDAVLDTDMARVLAPGTHIALLSQSLDLCLPVDGLAGFSVSKQLTSWLVPDGVTAEALAVLLSMQGGIPVSEQATKVSDRMPCFSSLARWLCCVSCTSPQAARSLVRLLPSGTCPGLEAQASALYDSQGRLLGWQLASREELTVQHIRSSMPPPETSLLDPLLALWVSDTGWDIGATSLAYSNPILPLRLVPWLSHPELQQQKLPPGSSELQATPGWAQPRTIADILRSLLFFQGYCGHESRVEESVMELEWSTVLAADSPASWRDGVFRTVLQASSAPPSTEVPPPWSSDSVAVMIQPVLDDQRVRLGSIFLDALGSSAWPECRQAWLFVDGTERPRVSLTFEPAEPVVDLIFPSSVCFKSNLASELWEAVQTSWRTSSLMALDPTDEMAIELIRDVYGAFDDEQEMQGKDRDGAFNQEHGRAAAFWEPYIPKRGAPKASFVSSVRQLWSGISSDADDTAVARSSLAMEPLWARSLRQRAALLRCLEAVVASATSSSKRQDVLSNIPQVLLSISSELPSLLAQWASILECTSQAFIEAGPEAHPAKTPWVRRILGEVLLGLRLLPIETVKSSSLFAAKLDRAGLPQTCFSMVQSVTGLLSSCATTTDPSAFFDFSPQGDSVLLTERAVDSGRRAVISLSGIVPGTFAMPRSDVWTAVSRALETAATVTAYSGAIGSGTGDAGMASTGETGGTPSLKAALVAVLSASDDVELVKCVESAAHRISRTHLGSWLADPFEVGAIVNNAMTYISATAAALAAGCQRTAVESECAACFVDPSALRRAAAACVGIVACGIIPALDSTVAAIPSVKKSQTMDLAGNLCKNLFVLLLTRSVEAKDWGKADPNSTWLLPRTAAVACVGGLRRCARMFCALKGPPNLEMAAEHLVATRWCRSLEDALSMLHPERGVWRDILVPPLEHLLPPPILAYFMALPSDRAEAMLRPDSSTTRPLSCWLAPDPRASGPPDLDKRADAAVNQASWSAFLPPFVAQLPVRVNPNGWWSWQDAELARARGVHDLGIIECLAAEPVIRDASQLFSVPAEAGLVPARLLDPWIAGVSLVLSSSAGWDTMSGGAQIAPSLLLRTLHGLCQRVGPLLLGWDREDSAVGYEGALLAVAISRVVKAAAASVLQSDTPMSDALQAGLASSCLLLSALCSSWDHKAITLGTTRAVQSTEVFAMLSAFCATAEALEGASVPLKGSPRFVRTSSTFAAVLSRAIVVVASTACKGFAVDHERARFPTVVANMLHHELFRATALCGRVTEVALQSASSLTAYTPTWRDGELMPGPLSTLSEGLELGSDEAVWEWIIGGYAPRYTSEPVPLLKQLTQSVSTVCLNLASLVLPQRSVSSAPPPPVVSHEGAASEARAVVMPDASPERLVTVSVGAEIAAVEANDGDAPMAKAAARAVLSLIAGTPGALPLLSSVGVHWFLLASCLARSRGMARTTSVMALRALVRRCTRAVGSEMHLLPPDQQLEAAVAQSMLDGLSGVLSGAVMAVLLPRVADEVVEAVLTGEGDPKSADLRAATLGLTVREVGAACRLAPPPWRAPASRESVEGSFGPIVASFWADPESARAELLRDPAEAGALPATDAPPPPPPPPSNLPLAHGSAADQSPLPSWDDAGTAHRWSSIRGASAEEDQAGSDDEGWEVPVRERAAPVVPSPPRAPALPSVEEDFPFAYSGSDTDDSDE